MSGDVMAMQKTSSDGDGRRCRACGPTGKHTRDVLMNLRRCIGEDLGINRRYIG